ncbi:MAG TPA: purine-nucleoside phosphorylase [Actinomycetota bacterium]|nr:purine-nucleoside phosphorylase [Actinomycetota bacterium]
MTAPRLGMILGSGLGAIAEALTDATATPYAELPGFPEPSVAGHGGTLHQGLLNGLPVAVFQGRKHVYETGDATGMREPIRWLKRQGAEALLVTNAAGSLNPDVGPGRLMLISDHINMLGVNPLTGPNDDTIGPRFPSLRDAYDPELRARLHEAARALGIDLAEGVYLATAGPSFETPAEIRAFRTLGADAVGMSTVPEVILARHAGLRVAAVSAITNLAEGMGGEELSHEQTLRNAEVAARDLIRLVGRFAEDYARS